MKNTEKVKKLRLMAEGQARQYAGHFIAFLEWLFFGILLGLVAGVTGALFFYAIAGMTTVRMANPWIFYLLPVGGLIVAGAYHFADESTAEGTDCVIEAIRTPKDIPARMGLLIFFSTVATHFFGGSAGREGAALQIGGSMGYSVGRLFHMKDEDRHIVTMCGMAACFAALFGTPLTAVVFVMEVVAVGNMQYAALVPCAAAALVGSSVARVLRIAPTAFAISCVPVLNLESSVQTVVLAVLCAVLSAVFCGIMRGTGWLFRRFLPNTYLRAAVGGTMILLLTFLFGRNYIGMGSDGIAAAMQGHTEPAAFALKLLFTAITLGCGFRGGEIVPAFFVGSTFGCAMGGLLGLNQQFAASIGFMAMFCGITNCPITAFILSLEVFGKQGAAFYLIAAGISYMLSGYSGIYKKQQILFSKRSTFSRAG